MRAALRLLTAMAFIAAVFIIGFSAGLCIKVFMVRGLPVTHSGSELLILLAIPASIMAGYIHGRRKSTNHDKRGRLDEDIEHTD